MGTEEIQKAVEDAVSERVDFETRDLSLMCKCLFSDKEKIQFGQDLADAHDRLDQVECDFDSVKSRHKADVDQIESEINVILQKIRTGWENRRTDCVQIRDYRTGLFQVKRKDTGEIVEERALTFEERQANLPLKEKEKGEEVDAEFAMRSETEFYAQYIPSSNRIVFYDSNGNTLFHASWDDRILCAVPGEPLHPMADEIARIYFDGRELPGDIKITLPVPGEGIAPQTTVESPLGDEQAAPETALGENQVGEDAQTGNVGLKTPENELPDDAHPFYADRPPLEMSGEAPKSGRGRKKNLKLVE